MVKNEISIKIISCNVIREMWYSNLIYENFLVYDNKNKKYYQLVYQKNKIIFKKDTIYNNE